MEYLCNLPQVRRAFDVGGFCLAISSHLGLWVASHGGGRGAQPGVWFLTERDTSV